MSPKPRRSAVSCTPVEWDVSVRVCFLTRVPIGYLAPFDDEMSIAFRGPMTLYNIAVYQPTNSSSASWKQVSSWAAGEKPSNLVFMNNDGGDVSGEWSSRSFPVRAGDCVDSSLFVMGSLCGGQSIVRKRRLDRRRRIRERRSR